MAAVTFEDGGLLEPRETGLKKLFEEPWKRDDSAMVKKPLPKRYPTKLHHYYFVKCPKKSQYTNYNCLLQFEHIINLERN